MSEQKTKVTVEWLEPNKLVLFRLPDVKRASINAYIDGNLEILHGWDPARPLYTIQDISGPDVELTGYLRSRLSSVADYIKEHQLHVTSAIVMQNDFAGQIMRLFGQAFTIRSQYLTQVFFVNIDSAKTWINQQMTMSD